VSTSGPSVGDAQWHAGNNSLSESLFSDLIESVVREAVRNGFKRNVMFNCHRQNVQPLEIIDRKMHCDVNLDNTFSAGLNDIAGLTSVGSSKFVFKGSKVGLFPLSKEVNASGPWADVSNASAERGEAAYVRLCEYVKEFVEAFATMEIMATSAPRTSTAA
jgi:creatinine amidohydrolase